jgi:hypothetical protein
MPFVDRDLKPLTVDEWKYRYLDPNCSTVIEEAVDINTRVETFWIGWYSIVEPKPYVFGVRVVLRVEGSWKPEDPAWCCSEDEALKIHKDIVKTLKEPAQAISFDGPKKPRRRK